MTNGVTNLATELDWCLSWMEGIPWGRAAKPTEYRWGGTSCIHVNVCMIRKIMESITVPCATPFPAYVLGEKGKPAVIVIQEWWGVTDEIKAHAAKIAAAGYRVLVPGKNTHL